VHPQSSHTRLLAEQVVQRPAHAWSDPSPSCQASHRADTLDAGARASGGRSASRLSPGRCVTSVLWPAVCASGITGHCAGIILLSSAGSQAQADAQVGRQLRQIPLPLAALPPGCLPPARPSRTPSSTRARARLPGTGGSSVPGLWEERGAAILRRGDKPPLTGGRCQRGPEGGGGHEQARLL